MRPSADAATAPRAPVPLKAAFAEPQDFTFFRRHPFNFRRDVVTGFYTTTLSTWLFLDRTWFLSFLSLAFFYTLVSFVKQLCRKTEQVCFYISDGFNLFKPVDILVILNSTCVFEDVFEACFYNKCFLYPFVSPWSDNEAYV